MSTDGFLPGFAPPPPPPSRPPTARELEQIEKVVEGTVAYEAVPDTTPQEVAEALRWSARKDLREGDELEAVQRNRNPRLREP